jgi:pyruvate/2-oxoglutarate/acetoin dehydrogenase E1 component
MPISLTPIIRQLGIVIPTNSSNAYGMLVAGIAISDPSVATVALSLHRDSRTSKGF